MLRDVSAQLPPPSPSNATLESLVATAERPSMVKIGPGGDVAVSPKVNPTVCPACVEMGWLGKQESTKVSNDSCYY